jgi:hypothetical protein
MSLIYQTLKTRNVGDWTFKEVQKGYWKAYLNDRAIVLSGAADTKDIQIPFFHQFDRIELTQNTTADVLNADSFDFSLSRKLNSDAQVAQARSTIWNKTGLLYSDYGVNFPIENSQREPAIYTLTLTGTATNKIYPIMYFFGTPSSSF